MSTTAMCVRNMVRAVNDCKQTKTNPQGPIARIAPNHLVTSNPDFWAKINAVRSPYTRSPWYYHAARFEPGKDNVFTDCDNDSHDARRKKMAAGVSISICNSVQSLETR